MKNKSIIYVTLIGLYSLSIILANAQPYVNTIEENNITTSLKSKSSGLTSIETGHTIMKVRDAKDGKDNYIVGTSYEGIIVAIGYDGIPRWETPLSGVMNHDIWCGDITNDGIDEIFAANANGSIYCLNNKGEILWTFKSNEAPMYAVCVIKKDNTPYVVCGGFDMSIYYLTSTGKMAKQIKSSTYSIEKPWSKDKKNLPPPNICTANFIRPFIKSDGSTVLCVHGTNNNMNVKGTIYLFEPFADLPYRKDKVKAERVIGDFRVYDTNNDGINEIILGTSAHTNEAGFSVYNQITGKTTINKVSRLAKGYAVTQTEKIPTKKGDEILVLAGKQIRLYKPSNSLVEKERITGTYSFNDLWKDKNNQILLASAQSGGSCVHVINTKNPKWKKAFETLVPPGKIQKILDNSQAVRNQLKTFKAPSWEREPLVVTLMTERYNEGLSAKVAKDIKNNYKSPIFLKTGFTSRVESPKSWNRDTVSNVLYRNRRHRRRKYTLTQENVLNYFKQYYDQSKGMAIWGGHGGDPFYYSPQTKIKAIDQFPNKKTIFIYPEMGDHSDNLKYVINNLLCPIADHAINNNKDAYLFLRNKNIYWQSTVYKPMWHRLLSGEMADVVIPALEETTDKTMELSIAARLGLWSSGSVNQWGTRCVPDNTSFDRSREHSYQRLPNHFLRTYIYHVASGATFINNFAVDQNYISLLWELIAKGALYVPKREEIVSFSPVHLSMKEPNEEYMNITAGTKWTIFFDPEYEKNNKFVFNRMNGTWIGAPNVKYDFSSYAAGAIDRRLNFLPSYNNGMVLITPPQKGIFADTKAVRGKLVDKLHPIYKNILKEYITDGKNYFSSDGTKTYKPDEYYTTIANDIKENASKIPLTVEGDVAWVVAQTSPTHLRLTLIDGGYINPNDHKAIINFHTVSPKNMVDILDGKSFNVNNPASVEVDVPCGLFRFIDIELNKPL